jgi:hypothetical protein
MGRSSRAWHRRKQEHFMNRRQFLKAAAVSSFFSALWVRDAASTIDEMPYRTLGHTGEKFLLSA